MFSLLQKIPCITDLSEETQGLWEICLADIWRPTSLAEWKSVVDSPMEVPVGQTLFVNLPEDQRKELAETFGFPTIELPAFPPVEWVNQKLPDLFQTLCTGESKFVRQSEVAQVITNRVGYALPELVVLLVLDGLSFYDVGGWTFPASWRVKCEPCLVDGLSVTTSGMRRLIGLPCLTHRLFGLGYKQRLGFSYWERSQNRLTDELFAEFPPTQLFRVTTFEEVLHKLQASALNSGESGCRTFIQIVRTGLDGVCHNHREKPAIDTMLDGLKQNIEQIVEALRPSRKTMRIFATADHGILWFTDQQTVHLSPGTRSPRYVKGEHPSVKTVCIVENGDIYSVLTGDDKIARNRKVTEWGFHGGISAQESLVPFLDITPPRFHV